ncbi:MAG: hypothetical protein [Microviridae sp.]|nr:MAG: hypothetical protein [Microviridae sp.]
MLYTSYNRRDTTRSFGTCVSGWSQAATIPKVDPEADINVIYRRTQMGQNVNVSNVMPTYGDFTNLLQYDAMLEAIGAAGDAFASLDAVERRKYNDNPQEYYRATLEGLKNEESAAAEVAAIEEAHRAKEKSIQDALRIIKDNNVSVPAPMA